MTPATFRAARQALGLTQTELGARMGRSLRTIQAWEWGEIPIPLLAATVMAQLTAAGREACGGTLKRKRNRGKKSA